MSPSLIIYLEIFGVFHMMAKAMTLNKIPLESRHLGKVQ